MSETERTIIIVDDDPINRAILGNIFSDSFRIEQAQDGREGLDAILADPSRYCAVLLDFAMPKMDGVQVLQAMVEHGLVNRIPVFLITSEATNQDITRQAYDLGVMDVIGKPVVPYIVQRRVNSVVELFESRRRLVNTVSDQQLEILRQSEQIIELNRGMIEALAAAIEFRDGESGGHVRRIHDITEIMLSRTPLGEGLTESQIDSIAMASMMHDVGKIAIPDAILCKPGRLTPEEFEIVKTHAAVGAGMLDHVPQLKGSPMYEYAVDIARHHHERWDGNGYPDKLKGDQISIWAQIVALADVYDALRCRRVYKEPFSREKTMQMILGGECGAFNPALLEGFKQAEPLIDAFYDEETTQ